MSKDIKVYGAGGCGINILLPLAKASANKEAGFAKICPVFVDTSRSNLRGEVDEDTVFLIEGLDGSGKKRDSNYSPISDNVNAILHKHKPSEINIVIHSASGGKLAA